MTDTQKDEVRKRIYKDIYEAPDMSLKEHVRVGLVDYIIAKIEEAEKRGRENISIGVLQSIEKLYKLLSPEPIFPSSPINQFIRELQDLVLKSNLADK